MSIPFTQFLRPNGRTRSVAIEMDEETERKARWLISKGCHFDVEELTIGMVSMTCENPHLRPEDPVLSSVICSNDPSIDTAVKTLIEKGCAVYPERCNE